FTAGVATVIATLDTAGVQTITAIDASIGSVVAGTSNPVTVTPSAATQLVITSQPPATVAAGTGFGFSVAVEDAFANLEMGFSGNATVAILNNPAAATLGGTLVASISGGLATFSGLTLN